MPGSLGFGPDSRWVVYAAGVRDHETGKEVQLVVLGQSALPAYDAILVDRQRGGQIVFDSPTRLHYVARLGDAIWRVDVAIG